MEAAGRQRNSSASSSELSVQTVPITYAKPYLYILIEQGPNI